MGSLIERILTVPSVLVLVLVGLLVFAEDALFVGFVIPSCRPPDPYDETAGMR